MLLFLASKVLEIANLSIAAKNGLKFAHITPNIYIC